MNKTFLAVMVALVCLSGAVMMATSSDGERLELPELPEGTDIMSFEDFEESEFWLGIDEDEYPDGKPCLEMPFSGQYYECPYGLITMPEGSTVSNLTFTQLLYVGDRQYQEIDLETAWFYSGYDVIYFFLHSVGEESTTSFIFEFDLTLDGVTEHIFAVKNISGSELPMSDVRVSPSDNQSPYVVSSFDCINLRAGYEETLTLPEGVNVWEYEYIWFDAPGTYDILVDYTGTSNSQYGVVTYTFEAVDGHTLIENPFPSNDDFEITIGGFYVTDAFTLSLPASNEGAMTLAFGTTAGLSGITWSVEGDGIVNFEEDPITIDQTGLLSVINLPEGEYHIDVKAESEYGNVKVVSIVIKSIDGYVPPAEEPSDDNVFEISLEFLLLIFAVVMILIGLLVYKASKDMSKGRK